MSDLINLSLTQVAKQLQQGQVTALEVTTAALERIKATEPDLNALITICDSALEQASQLDSDPQKKSLPLFGVPITLKDLIATQGVRTTAGSKILGDFKPFFDATVAARLKAAGAVLVGKNNLDEFAMGSSTESSAFGPTHNPLDLTRTPGGSSGGSAASVVAKQCYGSLGTDTGGSIRQPASFCGCVGLKPTYGRVSRYGVIAYGSSLDQVGPLTRTVEDAALMLQVIAGHDPKDSTSAPNPTENYLDFSQTNLQGITLGVVREFMDAGMDAGVNQVCQDSLAKAKDLGAKIVEISLPHATHEAIATYYILAMAEASSNLSRFDGIRYGYRVPNPESIEDLSSKSRSQGFGAEVQRRILLGTYVLSAGYYDAYYRKAAQVRNLIRQDYLQALTQCQALFMPISPTPAWKLGTNIDDPLKMYLMDIFTSSLNLAGLPGLAIPMGQTEHLPVGMQLVAEDFSEAKLLRLGKVLMHS